MTAERGEMAEAGLEGGCTSIDVGVGCGYSDGVGGVGVGSDDARCAIGLGCISPLWQFVSLRQ